MKKINTFIYYYVIILFLEILTKYLIIGNIINIGLLYTIIFTIPYALFFTFLTHIYHSIINKILLYISTIILVVYYEFQYIFTGLFSIPFSFSTISLADQAFDFSNIVIEAVTKRLPQVLLILIPLLISLIFIKIKLVKYNKEQNISILILIVISSLLSLVYLLPNKSEQYSSYDLYMNVDDQNALIDRFGFLTYQRIDIKRVLFGFEQEVTIEPQEIIEEPVINSEYKENITNIDFDNLINNETDSTLKSMHQYFNNSQGSYQNEYTGKFKGKNLIFILAEGFNEVAVDQNRTPTLYNMIHTGFNFTNFYSPVFLSTTGGEFQATTGLIPTQEVLKLWKSKEPTISYALGNVFKNEYNVQSYHDWTYTYYKRNVTMKTLGFDNYMGCGNGMENLLSCKWLPSDIEMMKQTSPLYMNNEKFVTYYVTVSGHSPYETGANIVKKYSSTVSDLNISSNIKNYLSSQVELDRALEELLNQLTTTNQLDNTVIALVGDHYPYTLDASEINEVSTYKKDNVVEVNHSNFILWSNDMEPVTIEKTGSQIDVLPTLLNLFGVEYDSRLIMGKDILSTYEGLAIFSNRSWVTDKGTYFASTKKFVSKDGTEASSDYINRINNRVANEFTMSKLLIDNDYYQKVLNNE